MNPKYLLELEYGTYTLTIITDDIDGGKKKLIDSLYKQSLRASFLGNRDEYMEDIRVYDLEMAMDTVDWR